MCFWLTPRERTARQFKIKVGTLRRQKNDLEYFIKEHDSQKLKIEALGATSNNDEYDIRKQKEALAETAALLPDCWSRLQAAVADVADFATVHEDDLNDQVETHKEARTLLELVPAMLHGLRRFDTSVVHETTNLHPTLLPPSPLDQQKHTAKMDDRQFKIKVGTLRRYVVATPFRFILTQQKDLEFYMKELAAQTHKIDAMRATGTKDEYEIRKQEEVLLETTAMLPDCRMRLKQAMAAVADCLAEVNEELVIVEEATALLGIAAAALQPQGEKDKVN